MALVVGALAVGAGIGALAYTLGRAIDEISSGWGDLGDFNVDLDLPGSGADSSYAPTATHGVTPRWSAASADGFTSAPVAADGEVFVRDQTGQVRAYDAATGTPRWTREIGGAPLVEFAPVAVDGAVFVTGGYAFRTELTARDLPPWSSSYTAPEAPVFALDAATGAVRWRTAMHGAGGHPLTVADHDVYVNADTLAALDAATGVVRWVVEVGNGPMGGYSAPAVMGDTVAVGGGDGRVHAFDRATGVPRWTVPVSAPAGFLDGAGPVVVASSGGFLVVGPDRDPDLPGDHRGPGHVRALDAATGSTRWTKPVRGLSSLGAFPTVHGTTAFVPGSELYAFDVADGTPRPGATVRAGTAFAFTPLTFAADDVFVPGADGRLHAVDTRTGANLGVVGAPRRDPKGRVVAVPPAIAGDTAFLASGDRRLYAYPVTALTCRPPLGAGRPCRTSAEP